jgi:hypothetical protein
MAHIVIDDFGLAPDLAVRVVRYANAAGVRDAFEAGRDIDAASEDIVVIDDDVADVDADTKFDSLGFRHIDIAVRHPALDLDRATHRIDRAGKLDQYAVAGGLDDAAAMLGDFRIEQRLPARFQSGQGAFFVASHQAAVAGDARRENRRKTPFHTHVAQEAPFDGKYFRPVVVSRTTKRRTLNRSSQSNLQAPPAFGQV